LSDEDLKNLVFESLDLARENGFIDMAEKEDVVTVAVDLLDYDSDIYDATCHDPKLAISNLLPHIEAWRVSKGIVNVV